MTESSSGRDPVEELAEDYLERLRRGDRPTVSEYVRRHPEHAEAIREVFSALAKIEQLRPSGGEAGVGRVPDEPATGRRIQQLGDFRIIREVGRGGMGVVYEAEQISLGRRVALKVLPGGPTRNDQAVERFRREARAAARLHHTNIVPVFEVGQHGDIGFYAMQFIQGQGLDLVVRELKRLRDQSPGSGSEAHGPSTDDPVPPTDSLRRSGPASSTMPSIKGRWLDLVVRELKRLRDQSPGSGPEAHGLSTDDPAPPSESVRRSGPDSADRTLAAAETLEGRQLSRITGAMLGGGLTPGVTKPTPGGARPVGR